MSAAARRVLITGASIAGNCAAWWLVRYGFDLTVVEKSLAFRDAGQNVDVRGVAREVLRKMDLDQAALDAGTGESGIAFVDENDEIIADFGVEEAGGEGPTAELEILRGDLARLLYEPASERATYRFGDQIASLEQDAHGVTVEFESGGSERYDVVIVAEGVGSSTRELLFAGENTPRWMDVTVAYFTIPKGPTDSEVARWFNAPGGRSFLIRPDSKGTTRAFLTLQKPPEDEQDWSADRQRSFIRERFADAGWEAPRVLDGMENADDFYFEVLRQVRMDRWSAGRVVLTGDAAWCATPISGIGTTLAIVGAYVLAGELSKSADLSEAYAAYERIMRPFVEEGQSVPKIMPRLLNPHSRIGVALLRGALRVIEQPVVKGAAMKLFVRNPQQLELPKYGSPTEKTSSTP